MRPDEGDEEPTGEEQVANSPRERRLELVVTVLLAYSALLSAWCGYEASRFSGDQNALFARAARSQVDATRADSRADVLMQIDVIAFTGWVDATKSGNDALADFYRERFRDEFQPAFTAWLVQDPLDDPDAPSSPFALAEYRPAQAVRAERVREEALAFTVAAERTGATADKYVLTVVLFAAALFLLGIQSRIGVFELRVALVSVAGAIVGATTLWVLTLPRLWPW